VPLGTEHILKGWVIVIDDLVDDWAYAVTEAAEPWNDAEGVERINEAFESFGPVIDADGKASQVTLAMLQGTRIA
jgi:hypothetical protein